MERTVIVYLCLILISARLGVESRPQETRNSAAGDNQLLAAAYMLEAAESITENNNEDDDDEKKTDDEMATKPRYLNLALNNFGLKEAYKTHRRRFYLCRFSTRFIRNGFLVSTAIKGPI